MKQWTWQQRKTAIIGGALAVILILGGGAFALNKPDSSPNTNEQTQAAPAAENEQKSESTEQQQERLTMQPDINNAEFILSGANVSCSTTTVNGVTSRICSGNIHITPKADESISPGLYKINEQTKLLHDGQEQDLTDLQQLAQVQTVVRLTLEPGSEALLAEIRY